MLPCLCNMLGITLVGLNEINIWWKNKNVVGENNTEKWKKKDTKSTFNK